MKMSNYFICCEKCFETIAHQSTNSAKFWMELCALHLKHGEYLTFYAQDFPELRTLEVLGFIVSTENPLHLTIQIKGYNKTDTGEDFFCLQEGCHER